MAEIQIRHHPEGLPFQPTYAVNFHYDRGPREYVPLGVETSDMLSVYSKHEQILRTHKNKYHGWQNWIPSSNSLHLKFWVAKNSVL
jgi:hypothetical protein